MKEKLQKEFQARFRSQPKHIFFCPGRINLIGEHIDYNGGRVMPCAISLGTWLAVGKNNEDVFRFQALNFPESAEIPVQSSYEKNGNEWYYYPLGVINQLSGQGNSFKGLDMLFAGDLPIGSGLSSSASIEVVTIFALDQIFELHIPPKEMAVLSKKVENEFIGVNSGIMDQFAVVMGRKDHALLLDCDTLEFEYLPLNLNQYILAIINTNKPRKLVESRYNERYGECRQALAALQQELNIRHLCEIAPDDYLAHRHLINDPIIEKRALHVVLENERVEKAVQALKANDLLTFGKLMFASHQSLEELYEVSGEELDTIVSFCRSFDGCIGARMTGAGFGGCAIALVKKDKFNEFEDGIKTYYNDQIGYEPAVIASGAEEGVKEVGKE